MARHATKIRVQTTVSSGASKHEVQRWVKATKLLFELRERRELQVLESIKSKSSR
jgi:hypothetical protein